jgi:very-short-patch-repair endonuclease
MVPTVITTGAAIAPEASNYEPTWIERRLYGALDALGVAYRPQHPVGWYTLDAYLPAHRVAVEADGCMWHGCLECGYDEARDRGRRARDARRDKRLFTGHAIFTVRIPGHDLDCADAPALRAVSAALERAGVLHGDERSEPPPSDSATGL